MPHCRPSSLGGSRDMLESLSTICPRYVSGAEQHEGQECTFPDRPPKAQSPSVYCDLGFIHF